MYRKSDLKFTLWSKEEVSCLWLLTGLVQRFQSKIFSVNDCHLYTFQNGF